MDELTDDTEPQSYSGVGSGSFRRGHLWPARVLLAARCDRFVSRLRHVPRHSGVQIQWHLDGREVLSERDLIQMVTGTPNHRIEVNRHQSARFGLAREGGPGQYGAEGSVRRSPQQQRWAP